MDIKSAKMTQDQENNEWYIFKNCSKHGPLTLSDINGLLVKNQITKDHHVWHAKYNNWMAIKDLSVFENVGFDVPSNKINSTVIKQISANKPKTNPISYSKPHENFGLWKKIKNLIGY